MTPSREFGQTNPAPVNILPELVFDFSEAQPLPANLGKTEVPVNILPELVLDSDRTPALQLGLYLRPGTKPLELALDILRLYAAVNQWELSHHGKGLIPDETLCDMTTGGAIRVTLRPVDPSGAAERLTVLVTIINGAANSQPGAALKYPSIERCEARIVAA